MDKIVYIIEDDFRERNLSEQFFKSSRWDVYNDLGVNKNFYDTYSTKDSHNKTVFSIDTICDEVLRIVRENIVLKNGLNPTKPVRLQDLDKCKINLILIDLFLTTSESYGLVESPNLDGYRILEMLDKKVFTDISFFDFVPAIVATNKLDKNTNSCTFYKLESGKIITAISKSIFVKHSDQDFLMHYINTIVDTAMSKLEIIENPNNQYLYTLQKMFYSQVSYSIEDDCNFFGKVLNYCYNNDFERFISICKQTNFKVFIVYVEEEKGYKSSFEHFNSLVKPALNIGVPLEKISMTIDDLRNFEGSIFDFVFTYLPNELTSNKEIYESCLKEKFYSATKSIKDEMKNNYTNICKGEIDKSGQLGELSRTIMCKSYNNIFRVK